MGASAGASASPSRSTRGGGPREGGRGLGAAANKGFEADHVEGRDETPERFGYRVAFLTKPRKQSALDMVPAGFNDVESIVGHACCCESGGWNENNIATAAKGRAQCLRVYHLKSVGFGLKILPRFVRISKTFCNCLKLDQILR